MPPSTRVVSLARRLADRPGRTIAVAAAIGLGLRLAFGFGYWVGKPLTNDEVEYLTLAENLAAGRGFTYGPGGRADGAVQGFSRPPLYPLFVAAVARAPLLGGDREAAIRRVKVAQAVVGAIGVGLVGGLASAAGPTAASLAALLAAVYPPLVWLPAYILSETLYSTLALASALALQRAVRGRTAALVWPGALAGAAALARSIGLAFIGLALVWLTWRRPPRAALGFALGALLVLAPWSLRSTLVHGRPILVAADGGVNFWVGNHPLARGEGDLAANPQLKDADLAFRRRHPGLTPEQLEPLYYRDALRSIAAQPVRWLGLLARKLFYVWVPIGPSYTLHSPRYFAASVVSYGLLLPFGLAGAVVLLRRCTPAAPIFLLAGSTILLELLFFPQERYRIPVLDPALIVCASAWVANRVARAADIRCATPS